MRACLFAVALFFGIVWLSIPAAAQSPTCHTTSKTVDGNSYTVTTADNCLWIYFSSGGALNVTLPTPGLIFGPTFNVTFIPLAAGSNLVLTVAPASDTGVQGLVNDQISVTFSVGQTAEVRITPTSNWAAQSFGAGSITGSGVAGHVTGWLTPTSVYDTGFPVSSLASAGSGMPGGLAGYLQYNAGNGAFGGYAIGSSFTITGGSTFDLASGAACFNLGAWSGDLVGGACTPPSLAVGSAARNLGQAGGALTGTYPNPDFNQAALSAAVGIAIGSPGGDLAGPTLGTVHVVGLQGVPVSSTPPTPQSALVFNGSQYAPTLLSPGVNQGVGDVLFGPGSGQQSTAIAPGVVTNSKMALMSAMSVKACTSATNCTPQDIPVTGGLSVAGGALTLDHNLGFSGPQTIGTSCFQFNNGILTGVTAGSCSGGSELTADDGTTVLTADDGVTHLTADGSSPASPCTAMKFAQNVGCNAVVLFVFRSL